MAAPGGRVGRRCREPRGAAPGRLRGGGGGSQRPPAGAGAARAGHTPADRAAGYLAVRVRPASIVNAAAEALSRAGAGSDKVRVV